MRMLWWQKGQEIRTNTYSKWKNDKGWQRMLLVWILRIVWCKPCVCMCVFLLEMSYDEHTSYIESNKEAYRKLMLIILTCRISPQYRPKWVIILHTYSKGTFLWNSFPRWRLVIDALNGEAHNEVMVPPPMAPLALRVAVVRTLLTCSALWWPVAWHFSLAKSLC